MRGCTLGGRSWTRSSGLSLVGLTIIKASSSLEISAISPEAIKAMKLGTSGVIQTANMVAMFPPLAAADRYQPVRNRAAGLWYSCLKSQLTKAFMLLDGMRTQPYLGKTKIDQKISTSDHTQLVTERRFIRLNPKIHFSSRLNLEQSRFLTPQLAPPNTLI